MRYTLAVGSTFNIPRNELGNGRSSNASCHASASEWAGDERLSSTSCLGTASEGAGASTAAPWLFLQSTSPGWKLNRTHLNKNFSTELPFFFYFNALFFRLPSSSVQKLINNGGRGSHKGLFYHLFKSHSDPSILRWGLFSSSGEAQILCISMGSSWVFVES